MNICVKCGSVVAALLVALSLSAQQPAENPAGAASPTLKTRDGTSSINAKPAIGIGADIGEPVFEVGGPVQPPIVVHQKDPKFSPEARRARFSGSVVIGMIVDSHGKPLDVHVIRGVGMGLDENAIDAVKEYRFRPARQNGKPVAVRVNVQVNFQYLQGPP